MKAIFLFLAMAGNVFSKGNSYSFIVKIEPSRVHVTSPLEITKDLSVIIENKTLGPIWGEIVNENYERQNILGIPSMETRSVLLKNYKKNQVYYFIPQSPPFQKIILKFDKSTYEIPPLK